MDLQNIKNNLELAMYIKQLNSASQNASSLALEGAI